MAGEIVVRYESVDAAIDRLRELEERARGLSSRSVSSSVSTGDVVDELASVREQASQFANALADAIASSAEKLATAELTMRAADDDSARKIDSMAKIVMQED